MLAFKTILLGLVFGLAPIRLTVSPPVVSVRVLVDGAQVSTLHGEPWEFVWNFGQAPLPHELEVVGLNAGGREVARDRQWVNVPRPGAEASVVVTRGDRGAVARLSWDTVEGLKPRRFVVHLDGRDVPVSNPDRIILPGVDMSKSHLLIAEVRFAKGVVAHAQCSFGGGVEAGTESELTAVPVVLRPGRELPPVKAMQDWFESGGKPLRVVGVEKGYSDVVAVFDLDCVHRFTGITPDNRTSAILRYTIPLQPSEGGDRLYGMWGVPQRAKVEHDEARAIFPISFAMDLDVDTFRALMFHWPTPAANKGAGMLANAVATAGMQASSLNRRRAVVLFVCDASPDASTISVEAARAYLEALDVPLFVWTPDARVAERELPGWGRAEDASTDLQLLGAVSRLQRALDAQRIVWVDGLHLPQSIGLTPGLKPVFIARGVVRQAPPTPR